MPSVRDEISKTFARIARLAEAEPKHGPDSPAPDFGEARQFGVYEIIHRLGEGGMGRVYLAMDTRLGRRVALKFLAPDLVADRTSLLRLVQEARAASALNHPNILTIYDVGEFDGEHFIASEYVEGITLRVALEDGLINSHSAVEIACQAASALSAAHAAGVIHRDLKPSNIMLRPDGYVKIIDFGLAKRVVSTSEETQMIQAEELTRPGTTLGTASYMSPEQARAEPVDARTDIWSLGIILYEMLAGRRPFEGQTQSHVIVAIQDQPLPRVSERIVSPKLRTVLERSLAKKPSERFSSAGEMLQYLQETVESAHPTKPIFHLTAPLSAAPPGRVKLMSAGALLLVLAIAGVIAWRYLQQPEWFHLEPVRQLTFNGRTQLATLSPDGKYLAYVVGQADGQQTLYLRQIDSPADEIKIEPKEIAYRGLTFSPDSQSLYIVEKENSDIGRLYAVPLIGQVPAHATLSHVDGPISFSPSGDKFAYVNVESADQRLIVANRDGQNVHVLLSLSGVAMLLRPAWSPDGRRIAVMLFRERSQAAGEAILDVVKLNGTETRLVMPGWERVGHLRWTPDGKSILTDVGTHADPNTQQIHQVWVAKGTDRALTKDLSSYKYVSLSNDGREITAVKTDSKASIWVSEPGDLTHGEIFPGQAERHPSLAWTDSGHLVVDSRRTGFVNFALLDLHGRTFNAFTNEKQAEQSAVVIPGTNGKSIVLSSNRSGEFHIWRFDSDANRWQQLTNGNSYEVSPSVSPDGKWVVYVAQAQAQSHLMRVPIKGGTAEQVGTYAAEQPEISPDGKSIACFLYDPAGKTWGVAIIPFVGSGKPHTLSEDSTSFRWSPDGKSLTIVRTDANGISNLWRVPLNGDAPEQLTHFDDLSILGLAWSPSGDRIALLRAQIGADVTLFRNTN
jgi:serine/threonine protein kinase